MSAVIKLQTQTQITDPRSPIGDFMRRLILLAACCASIFLTSCANHSKDYLKKDQDVNSIVVPPGVPIIKQEPYYPVPNIPPENTTAKTPNLKPPTLLNE